jgi:hypothetical protein
MVTTVIIVLQQSHITRTLTLVTLYATFASVDISKHNLFRLLIMPQTMQDFVPYEGNFCEAKLYWQSYNQNILQK